MIQPRHADPANGKSERRWLLAGTSFLLLALAVMLAIAAFNQPAAQPALNLESEMLRVAKGLYCPVCPSTPLDVCETQACVQWRALIKEKLAAGESEGQIRAYFVAQYGERVLGAPPAEGFNLGAYVFPFILLIAGALFLVVTMRGWQARQAAQISVAPAEQPSTLAPEVAERIRRALKERE